MIDRFSASLLAVLGLGISLLATCDDSTAATSGRPGPVDVCALGICEFFFYSATSPQPKDFKGNCVIQAIHLDDIGLAIYRGRPRVAGLGDEAFDDYGTTVVRVKNILLRPGECSLGDRFLVDMYKRMVGKLR